MRVFAALFLVLGVILLGAAVVAVIRGVIWRDPFRVKLIRHSFGIRVS